MLEGIIAQITLLALAQAGVFTSASKVRENEAGYKFITLIKGKKANNLYLGKGSAELVVVGTQVPRELLKDASVVLVKNSEGEERLKLSLGSTDYESVDSIFSIETEAEHSEVMLARVASEMTEAEEVVSQEANFASGNPSGNK